MLHAVGEYHAVDQSWTVLVIHNTMDMMGMMDMMDIIWMNKIRRPVHKNNSKPFAVCLEVSTAKRAIELDLFLFFPLTFSVGLYHVKHGEYSTYEPYFVICTSWRSLSQRLEHSMHMAMLNFCDSNLWLCFPCILARAPIHVALYHSHMAHGNGQ